MPFQDRYIASWLAPATLHVLTATTAAPPVWTALTCSYTPTSGVLANPQVYQHANGTWYLGHSNADARFGWANYPTSAVLSLASSSDGLTFTPLVDLDYSALFQAVFGFTWFNDRAGVLHIIFPGSPVGGAAGDSGLFQLYEIHPTNAGLTTWSTPAAITGTSLPSTYQDPYIVDDGSNYYVWYAPGYPGVLKNATSAAAFPLTGWTVLHSNGGDWTGSGINGDGPTCVQIGSTWWLFQENTSGTVGVQYVTTPVNPASDWRAGGPSWSALATVTSVAVERTGSNFLIRPPSTGLFGTVFAGAVR